MQNDRASVPGFILGMKTPFLISAVNSETFVMIFHRKLETLSISSGVIFREIDFRNVISLLGLFKQKIKKIRACSVASLEYAESFWRFHQLKEGSYISSQRHSLGNK